MHEYILELFIFIAPHVLFFYVDFFNLFFIDVDFNSGHFGCLPGKMAEKEDPSSPYTMRYNPHLSQQTGE